MGVCCFPPSLIGATALWQQRSFVAVCNWLRSDHLNSSSSRITLFNVYATYTAIILHPWPCALEALQLLLTLQQLNVIGISSVRQTTAAASSETRPGSARLLNRLQARAQGKFSRECHTVRMTPGS